MYCYSAGLLFFLSSSGMCLITQAYLKAPGSQTHTFTGIPWNGAVSDIYKPHTVRSTGSHGSHHRLHGGTA